jgi:hypothetical protein
MDGQMREWRVPFWVYATAVGVLAYFVQPFILAGTLGTDASAIGPRRPCLVPEA